MKRLIHYNNPGEFWDVAAPHLKKDAAKNNLCLGLSANFKKDAKDCLGQLAVFSDGQFLCALVCSRYGPRHNLLPSPTSDMEAAQLLINGVRDLGIKYTDLVAEEKTADLYQKIIMAHGQNLKVTVSNGLYICKHVKMPKFTGPFRLRTATTEDENMLAQWIYDFMLEAVPHDPRDNTLRMAQEKIKSGMIYLLEVDGKPVASAQWSRDMGDHCSISFVYTPREFRKRGYGSMVTAQLTQKMLLSGKKDVSLFTDISNPTSNKIYQDIGYEFVCNSLHMSIS